MGGFFHGLPIKNGLPISIFDGNDALIISTSSHSPIAV